MAPRLLYFSLLLIGFSCSEDRPLLDRLDNEVVGIDFVNLLTEDDEMNPMQFEYVYNGAGVGVGDFDANGLPDLVFSGNMVSTELYLQVKPWQFRKVTGVAGVATTAWVAGVNIHDVDGNGYEDIYLATLHPDQQPTPNLLFLNEGPGADGIPRFREAAAELGIADTRYGSHSAWIDLENDGDLDLYVLNNSIEEIGRKQLKGTDTSGTAKSMDGLYLNLVDSSGAVTFTKTDWLREEGWGLGLVPGDFNGDGYTDLYVANDFWSRDHYFINDGSGKLAIRTNDAFVHTSRNSMGVDAADLNNDGLLDIMTADMLPNTNLRRKTMFGDLPFSVDRRAYEAGYGRQYIRNTLQINMGDGTYSDLALLTGTADSDWSWTPLLADFDNDGFRDIFLSNGYPKDVTNRDFVDYSQVNAVFGTDEEIKRKVRAMLDETGGIHQPNFLYRNHGDLTFRRAGWLDEDPTYSNGAVYVDLDLDGDLDLVTNNINEPAGIYRNQLREIHPDNAHFIQIELEGTTRNPDGLGTKFYLWSAGQRQYAEQQRQRGYLSTVDAVVHFGLGEATVIDSLLVVWPDGANERFVNLEANQRLRVRWSDASSGMLKPPFPADLQPQLRLLKTPVSTGPRHVESAYTDFDNSALAVRDNSRQGPALAVSHADPASKLLVLGGAAGQATTIYEQVDGELELRQVLDATTPSEAVSLALFDADDDGDDDLYVGNGSSEFSDSTDRYLDQFYRNDKGTFRYEPDVLPPLKTVTAAVAVGDLEGDGDLDMFIGARYLPGAYPRSDASYVLVNEGNRFVKGEDLDLGLVTSATWTQPDADSAPELIVLAEYGLPQIGRYQDGKLRFSPIPGPGKGWWYSVTASDLDGDGDQDLLLGNLGLNSSYRADEDHPLTLRVQDYDHNGTLDPIMMQYNGSTTHPVHPRNTLMRQLPGFKRQATTYARYGGWTDENMPPLTEDGFELSATDFRSYYLRNDGGRYTTLPLPTVGQIAPVRGAVPAVDGEGRPILLAVQNDHAIEVLGGRLDAGNGFALRIDEAGEPVIDHQYWSVREDARSVVKLGGSVYVGVNDGPLLRYVKAQDPATK